LFIIIILVYLFVYCLLIILLKPYVVVKKDYQNIERRRK